MARAVKIIYNGNTYETSIQALNREKLYGFVEEIVQDQLNKPCIAGALLEDGQTLIAKGCTSNKIVDEYEKEVNKKTLRAVDTNGKTLSLVKSVFETGIVLQAGSLEDLFDLEVEAVYDFDWSNETTKQAFLKETQGKILTCEFNYRTDYEGLNGILVSNKEGAFVLAGRMLSFEFLDNKIKTIIEIPEYVDEEDDSNMDFSMF